MPRFFIDVRDGQDIPDKDGSELADIATLRREAITLAGQLLIDDPDSFWQQGHLSISVRDGCGMVLFKLNVDAVLSPAMPPETLPFVDRGD